MIRAVERMPQDTGAADDPPKQRNPSPSANSRSAGYSARIALALLAVDVDPLRHRLDPSRAARTVAATASSHVGPDAGGHAAEDRRAERRALVDGHALERQLEHRGDDLQPQVAARAAAGDATRAAARPPSAAIRSSESRSPKATPSSTARTSAPRSWRSSGRRTRRARRGRRAACARRPGRAGRSAPRRPPASARPPPRSVVVVDAGRERVAQPAQRARRRQHHAHRVPGAGHGVAERVHARLRVGRETRRSAANTTPEVPSTTETGPGRSTPTPSAPAAWSPAPAATGTARPAVVARYRRALEQRRQPARGRAPARRAPRRSSARCGDVEQQRPGRVGDVGGVLAAQPQADVVLGQQRSWRSGRRQSGSWRRSHSSFGAVKPGSARLPVSSISRSRPTVSSISAHSAAGALVVPEDRRAQHAVAPRRARPARASGRESPIPSGAPAAAAAATSTDSVACHQSSGSCSAQPGRGVESG